LNAWLGQSVPWAHRAHLTTCWWVVVALLQRGEVSLTRRLPYAPCRGVQAQNKQRRLSRWLYIVISTNIETVVGLIYRECSRLRRLMLIESNYSFSFPQGRGVP
jgi:hypothetical protein